MLQEQHIGLSYLGLLKPKLKFLGSGIIEDTGASEMAQPLEVKCDDLGLIPGGK